MIGLTFIMFFLLKANQYKIRVMSTSNQGSTWGKLELQFIGRDGANETFTLTNEADEIKDTGFIQVYNQQKSPLNLLILIKLSSFFKKMFLHRDLLWRILSFVM
jgi:hypothetical protein